MFRLRRPVQCGLALLLLASAAQAGEKKLRVAFGDNRTMPTQLLKADDLVCSPGDLGLGSNNPQMRISKFTAATKMTPEAIAQRKEQGFNWICYDNENGKDWPTPKEEITDPTKYTLMAAKATHAAGLKFIAEPNFELIVGRGSRGKDGKLEMTDKQVPFVRLKEVAPHLDAISLQFQRAQADIEQYRELRNRKGHEGSRCRRSRGSWASETTRHGRRDRCDPRQAVNPWDRRGNNYIDFLKIREELAAKRLRSIESR
jgi:hypothetical protein